MLLSIIIPYYNTKRYTDELLKCLEPQITKDVEVILVDDGSPEPFKTDKKWVKVIRKENGGPASSRNRGLDIAKGKYVTFIDSDDLVAHDYVVQILKKAESDPDVIDFSWKTFVGEGAQADHKLYGPNDWLPNPSVCTRAFKRSFIGDKRMNEKKDSTEDEEFSRKLGYRYPDNPIKHDVITDYMYFYRTAVVASSSKRYVDGLKHTKRITYYYPAVTADMTWLLEQIKKEDEENEVILLTNKCEIPEMRIYCTIFEPRPIWSHYAKGDACSMIHIIQPPIRTQIAIYRKNINKVGGINTFMTNFITLMRDKYDITVVCETIDAERLGQLLPIVRVVSSTKVKVACGTLLMMSALDKVPENVTSEKIIRTVHALKSKWVPEVPNDCDNVVYVSEVCKKSFEPHEGVVIHNPYVRKEENPLILVSATRIPAPDKGEYVERMRKLANMLNAANIPFVWLNFSDGSMPDPPRNFYNMPATTHIEWFMDLATYVVQLSDFETWSYTIVEGLSAHKPVICTPFPSIYEIGVKDGLNAHIVPFDMDFDVNILLDVPVVDDFVYTNSELVAQWEKLIGETKPCDRYVPGKQVLVEVTFPYTDVILHQHLNRGQQLMMDKDRARYLQDEHPFHVVRMIGG